MSRFDQEALEVAVKAVHVEKHWLDGHGGNCPSSKNCGFLFFDAGRITETALNAYFDNLHFRGLIHGDEDKRRSNTT